MAASDPDWKGSNYNVQVEWETGEITVEHLSVIAADDPVTCAAMPKSPIYLLWKDAIGLGTLPRKMKSLQWQASKVRSGKSGDPKPTSLGT